VDLERLADLAPAETKMMNYLMACPMWVWAVVGILLIVASIVLIAKLLRK